MSLNEARRALSKAKAHVLGTQSNTSRTRNSGINLKKELEKETWEEGLAYEKYTQLAREAQRLGENDVAQILQQIARDEFRHREELERITRRL